VTCVRADFLPGEDDTDIPESRNGVPDLLDEARWGLEWLLSVQ
jgi:endoglucanase